jgi:hypothetical protein
MTSRTPVYDMLGYPAETIGEGTQKDLIPPERCVGQTPDGMRSLDLSGLEFEIGYGQNDDQDAPYFAILLEVHPKPASDELADVQAAHRAHRTLVFRKDPPVDWIHGLVDGQYLVRAALEDRDGTHLADTLGLIANLALTPAARVLVRRDYVEGRYMIQLSIDGRDRRGNAETWHDEVYATLPLTLAGT